MKFARRLFVNDLKKNKIQKNLSQVSQPSKGVVDCEAIVGAVAELGVAGAELVRDLVDHPMPPATSWPSGCR